MQSLQLTVAALKMAAVRARNFDTTKHMPTDKNDKPTTNDNPDTSTVNPVGLSMKEDKELKALEKWRQEDCAAEQVHRKLRRDIISMFPEHSVVLEKNHRNIKAVTLMAPDGREITFGLPNSTPEYVHLAITLTEKE